MTVNVAQFVANTSIIAHPNDNRMTAHPVTRPKIWALYETAQQAFWVPHEIVMTADTNDWANLSSKPNGEAMKLVIKNVLAFFAVSDGLVNKNLSINFSQEVPILEVEYFYRFQQMMEDIHAITYSNMINTLLSESHTTHDIFESIKHMPAIQVKIDWATKWMDPSNPFEQRLLAFAIVEGIFFSGSFCIIYWLGSLNLFPGLLQANKLISRDERLHVDHAVELYSMCTIRVPRDVWSAILQDAIAVEDAFVESALPTDLANMNQALLKRHIRHVANRLCVQLGYPAEFADVTNTPFDFEIMRDVEGATSFFERKVTEYQRFDASDMGDESDSESI